MSQYYCEGYVKEITTEEKGVAFTIEPVAPYFFEKKTSEGHAKKHLSFVDDSKNPNKVLILDNDKEQRFIAAKGFDLCAMLIAKANHMKVRVTAMKLT